MEGNSALLFTHFQFSLKQQMEIKWKSIENQFQVNSLSRHNVIFIMFLSMNALKQSVIRSIVSEQQNKIHLAIIKNLQAASRTAIM